MSDCEHCEGSAKCGCSICIRKAGLIPDVMKSRTVDCCYCKQTRKRSEEKENDTWPDYISGPTIKITYGRPQVDPDD